MAESAAYRLLVRPALPPDLDEISAIFTAGRGMLSFLPRLHGPDDDRAFLEKAVGSALASFVALRDDAIAGFIVTQTGWVEHLYVAPDHFRCGIGSALLRTAMAEQPELRLWTFQKNDAARRFYERHAFRPLLFTDGTENEEREPDVLYHWISTATG